MFLTASNSLFLLVPPVIKSHTEEYVVAVDQSVTLQCEAEGYPGPEISWHKDGQQIMESMQRRILSTGALQILFVQPEDSGRYTCTVANPAGSSTSSMELTVHGKELFLVGWGALQWLVQTA